MERVLLVLMLAAALLTGCAGEDEEKLPGGAVVYEVTVTNVVTPAPADIVYHDENGWPVEIAGHAVFPWKYDFLIEEAVRERFILYLSASSATPAAGSTLTVKISIDGNVRQTGSATGDADLFASAKDTY